jgi:hypothetical protein
MSRPLAGGLAALATALALCAAGCGTGPAGRLYA